MSQTIIFRDDTWDWVYYLVFFILIFSAVFFSILSIRILKLILKPNGLWQIIAKDKKSFPVKVSVWYNLILYACMTIGAIYLVWIGGQDVFNGFTRAEVSPDTVRLIYIWPMPCKSISGSEIREFKLKKMGRDRMNLELTTSTGEDFKSAGGLNEDIRKEQADFLKALHSSGS
jgi:hypothetical protein